LGPNLSAGTQNRYCDDDQGIGLYEELTGARISLSEYFDRSYMRRLTEKPPISTLDPKLAGTILLKRQSSYASTNLLPKLNAMAALLHGEGVIHFARDYSFRDIKADYSILLGNSSSNPWMEPFESRLGLRWEYDTARGTYYPVDTWSKPPDRDRFRTAGEGYASIALVPNLSGRGNVLILSSSGGAALAGAADFLGDEQSVKNLRRLLPQPRPGKFPYFEALLHLKSRSKPLRDASIVVCRAPRS
jgi:hypothetical protein